MFVGYINIRETIKWWDPHTKKLKYYSFSKCNEYNNKFFKGWSPGYSLMNGTSIVSLPTLKIDISYHPLIKDDIFEAEVKFPPRDTTIVIVAQ